MPLAASGRSRTGRILNGARLAAWYTGGVGLRASREDIDVYHSTTSLGPLRAGPPVVLTIFDATLVTMPLQKGLADRAFRKCFSVAAAKRADAILSPTRASAEEVSAAYQIPKERIRVAPLGVEKEFRCVSSAAIEAARSRYGLRFPYVLFVGAEPPRKNLSRLVEAFATLAPVYPDLHLVFAGPSSPRDRQVDEQVERRRLRPRFHRLGTVPRDQLPAIYGGAACLAVLSLCEGFGLPIVEGMAAGAPVVASNCSAIPEVAGDAAVLVDPLSVDAIGEGLDRVLGDSDLALDLRLRGRRRSETFDWAVTANLTAQLYRDLGGARRR
jgi:glycosyltransferase involved in cell wall biosynthesis